MVDKGNKCRPEVKMKVAGKEYTLLGDIPTLEAIQTEHDIDIYDLQQKIFSLNFVQTARILQQYTQDKCPLEDLKQYVVKEAGVSDAKFLVYEITLLSLSKYGEEEKNLERLSKLKAAAIALEKEQHQAVEKKLIDSLGGS